VDREQLERLGLDRRERSRVIPSRADRIEDFGSDRRSGVAEPDHVPPRAPASSSTPGAALS